jgi:hypothetical protein
MFVSCRRFSQTGPSGFGQIIPKIDWRLRAHQSHRPIDLAIPKAAVESMGVDSMLPLNTKGQRLAALPLNKSLSLAPFR